MDFTNIEISSIKIETRLREIQDEKLEKLIESIKEIGLISPISVLNNNGEFILIAGEHRLRAFEAMGNTSIPCAVHERMYDDIELDKARCIMMEVDENYVRTKLDRYEESYMLYMRKQAYEKLYPETVQWAKKSKAGKERHREESAPRTAREAEPKTFSQDTAEKLNLTESTVNRRVRRGTILDEETGRQIEPLKLTDKVIDLIVSGEDEKAKNASKIHMKTIKKLSEEILDEKERNKIFTEAFKDLKDKKDKVIEGYQKVRPDKFAMDLQEIMPVYIKDYIEDKKDESVRFSDNVLICTSSYLKKYPDTCTRFIKIFLDNACRFSKAHEIIKTFGAEEKIVIECINDEIFTRYMEKYN